MTSWLGMVDIVASSSLSPLPASRAFDAALTVADTVGVVLGGLRQPEMCALLDGPWAGELCPRVETESVQVLGRSGVRTTATAAAFLHATAGSFLELDEGIRPTGHPAMQVVPAALATAELRQASGAELIDAVIRGYEVAARLFRAFRLTHPIHPHGHFGAVGAAVGAALLLDVDPTSAAAVAGTSPLATSWAACLSGATARNTWMGSAAASGIRSAVLADAKFSGSGDTLNDAFGGPVDSAVLKAGFDWDQTALGTGYFKQHSACALTHAALDAALQLSVELEGPVESVVVETVENNLKVAAPARANDLSTRFSLPYAAAVGLLLQRTDPDAFRWRPEVGNFQKRVTVRNAWDLQEQWPERAPVRLHVRTRTGEHTAVVQNPHGYWTDPLSVTELADKFVGLVAEGAGSDTAARESWTLLLDLPNCNDVATHMSELNALSWPVHAGSA